MSRTAGDRARVGIGIELGSSIIRAVRVDIDRPGALVAADYPLANADERTLRDAIVRVSGVVSPASEPVAPVRIAVAPPSMLIQGVDVTGSSRHELLTIADRALRQNAADSMTVVDDGVHRRLLLVRWRQAAPEYVASVARHAGLANVSVEPAPLSLARVVGLDDAGEPAPAGGERSVYRRVVEPGVSWLALLDHGTAIAAASVATDLESPGLSQRPAPRREDDPETLLGGDELLRWLLFAATARGDDTPVTGIPIRDVSEWHDDTDAADRDTESEQHDEATGTSAELRVSGTAIPAYPGHDLRASERIAVALGAAVGAAGATERHRQLEPLASLRPTASGALAVRRPWAVEQVSRPTPPPPGRARLLSRRSRRSRRSDASRRYGRQR